MGKIQSISELDEAIQMLERKREEEVEMLRVVFYQTYESVKPINMIKNIFKESLEPQNIKDSLVNTSVGFGFGYLSKLLFQGVVRVPFKKIFGSALMLGVENLIAKNPEVVSSLASFILNTFSKKPEQNIMEEMEYEHQDIHREPDEEQIDLETIY
jgi:ABC-type dipeptide/oligopeptide/nickel transport system ATPase subunit